MGDVFSVGESGVTTQEIALTKCLHVSGTCWFESVVDGVYEDGEAGLPGVRIELDGMKNGLHYETISDENGNSRSQSSRQPAPPCATVQIR